MFFKTQSGRYATQLDLSRIQQQAATHCSRTGATYRALVLGNKHSGGDALSEPSGRACDSLTKSTIISKWSFHPKSWALRGPASGREAWVNGAFPSLPSATTFSSCSYPCMSTREELMEAPGKRDGTADGEKQKWVHFPLPLTL